MKRTAELTRTAFKRPTHVQHGAYLRMAPKTVEARAPVMRKCKVCRQQFQVFRALQKICDGEVCATAMVERAQQKAARVAARAERAADKEKRDALRKLSWFADRAQDEVNRYVRLRDAFCGCYTCDQPWSREHWDAGHLRGRGASPPTRFIVWAIRKQCVSCNQNNSGRADIFYRRLVAEVGQAKVDWLYAQNTPVKRSREYLVRLRAVFKRKADRQAKRNAQRGIQ